MDILKVLAAVVLIILPVLVYLWRDRKHRDPASRWPALGAALKLAYSADPPSLKGQWKGRPVELAADGGAAMASARFSAARPVRLEIGDRARVEKDAGMVVPDRVDFREDPGFAERFLVRATPPELGPLAVDAGLRRRLGGLGSVHVLASSGRVDVTVAEVTEEDQVRELFDVAVAVADAAEQA